MKKVLSVAMASAMVLGMGANAFAIQYSSGSNDKAEWPENFRFAGELFVTDKDGDLIEESTTRLNDSEAVDFQPGDVIWMPLYADNQIVWDSEITDSTAGRESASNVKTSTTIKVEHNDTWTEEKYNADKGQLNKDQFAVKVDKQYIIRSVTISKPALTGAYVGREADILENSERYFIGTTEYRTVESFKQALAEKNSSADAFVTVDLKGVDGTDTTVGKPVDTGKRRNGLYTGNIDKNWSINLIEKDGTVKDLIKKAELYKADKYDYASYKEYAEIQPNAVYLKITLKDSWKTIDSETLKYYVYLSNNNNNSDKTNQVWVSGKYAPSYRKVDFTWTNNANEASLWKAEESGTAVFDFADKAFFTVKMYKGETMYLDLSTAYDKAIAGEMDADAESFYKFDNTNANFAREGELVIVSDDDTLVPYEIDEDGNFVELDAEYVENYLIKNSNAKVNGFKFNTKQLGNYVLSTEELGAEEEVEEEEAEEVEEPAEEAPEAEEVPETNKPNPETGAEDFVGLAVSLAVVSVAAAGALALKK